MGVFYVLAFLPLLAIGYYRYVFFNNPTGALIPLYGFLLLLIRKEKLSEHSVETNVFQKVLGVFIVLCSFLVYYVIAPFTSWVGFIGIANYVIYLFGLFFVFFEISALKQADSAFFLIAVAALAGLSFKWIELQVSFTVPYYVHLFSSVLSVFGLKNTLSSPTTIMLSTPRGPLPVLFEAGCIGVYSLLIFSIIIVVTMLETSVSKRTKLVWSIVGLIGVFVVNVIRLLVVVVSMYFYGWDFGQTVHQGIGYILFLPWVAIFLLLFANREVLLRKLQIGR